MCNAKDIATFEKVSFKEFAKAWRKLNAGSEVAENGLRSMYDNIKLPRRATSGSAGYDFFTYADVIIGSDTELTIPTGIKCRINDGWSLQMYPRSGLGFKYGLSLANTVGIIDSDYYGNKNNEGHIFVKLLNGSIISDNVTIAKGEAYCQGIFLPYGLAVGDEVSEERTGGFGSTTKPQ